jgi:hypothetical protein
MAQDNFPFFLILEKLVFFGLFLFQVADGDITSFFFFLKILTSC